MKPRDTAVSAHVRSQRAEDGGARATGLCRHWAVSPQVTHCLSSPALKQFLWPGWTQRQGSLEQPDRSWGLRLSPEKGKTWLEDTNPRDCQPRGAGQWGAELCDLTSLGLSKMGDSNNSLRVLKEDLMRRACIVSGAK